MPSSSPKLLRASGDESDSGEPGVNQRVMPICCVLWTLLPVWTAPVVCQKGASPRLGSTTLFNS